jgi:hypothetical protein
MPNCRCIYCLKDKDKPKRVEHVIPQSFGVFKNNFVLTDAVCDDCNQFFGDALEISLARDTIEGVQRYDLQIKKPDEFKSLGKRSRLIIKVAEGFFQGSYAYRYYSEQEKRILLKPLPQVGFFKTDGSGYEYFLLKDIPSFKSLPAGSHNIGDSKGIIILGCDPAIADDILNKQGYSFSSGGEFDCPDKESSSWLSDIEGTIDQTIMRAVAKIALNYLAYWTGPEFVLHDSFNAIREFILSGKRDGDLLVRAVDKAILEDEINCSRRRVGHIVTVDWAGDKVSILAQVSLLNRITYQVILARYYSGEKIHIAKGNFFDVHNHVILDLGSKSAAAEL